MTVPVLPPARPSWPHAPGSSHTLGRASWWRRRLLEVLLPRRVPYACLALMAAQLALFLIEEQWGGAAFPATQIRMGAVWGESALGAEAWRLLAAGYLHMGWKQHLLPNLAALLLVGVYLEGLLGPSRLLLLYTLSILGSNMVLAGVSPNTFAMGSSGGIAGLVGAALVLTCRPRTPLTPWRRLAPGVVSAAIAVNAYRVAVACECGPGYGIAHVSHLSGVAVGVVLALSGVLLWRLPWPGWRELPSIRASACAAVGVTVAALACAVGVERPWELREPQPLVRVGLPGTAVSVSVPTGAAARAEVEDVSEDGSSTRVFYGDVMTDPLSVEVTVERLEKPVPEERLAAETEVLREKLEREAKEPPEEGMGRWSWLRTDELNGRPVLNSWRRMGTLFWGSRWVMYRGRWRITLEVVRPNGSPEAWDEQEMDVLRSVVVWEQGDLPWGECAAWNAVRTGICPPGPW